MTSSPGPGSWIWTEPIVLPFMLANDVDEHASAAIVAGVRIHEDCKKEQILLLGYDLVQSVCR